MSVDIKNKMIKKWMDALIPLYGHREALNMWKWYREAERPTKLFEKDLKLLKEYYPIQYLTGYTWFYGDKYYVNEHTLIPRPETEELVHTVLEDHPADFKIRILDLGTGSGCIPITLKKHRPSWCVSGLERYADTLHIARKNEQLHQSDIHWIHGDMLNLNSFVSEPFDIIISNPPYIPFTDKAQMERNVLDYEPHHALFTEDDNGLEFYESIAKNCPKITNEGAEIYLEIHENNSEKIAEIFRKDALFEEPEIIQDMQGKDRILKTKRSNI